jgi:hypothetical protein
MEEEKEKEKRNYHFFSNFFKGKRKKKLHFLMWQMRHVRKFPTWHICHLRKCHLFCFCFFSSLQKLKKERNYKLSIYYKCNPSYITWKKKKKKKKKKLTTVFHTPKVKFHNVLNVGKDTIPRGEDNRSESRRVLPQTYL